jgi:hypothetical protein
MAVDTPSNALNIIVENNNLLSDMNSLSSAALGLPVLIIIYYGNDILGSYRWCVERFYRLSLVRSPFGSKRNLKFPPTESFYLAPKPATTTAGQQTF